MEHLIHSLEHSFIDLIKILPFLLVAFLILEFIEHKLSNKNQEIIKKSGRIGPLIGSLLGALPQCGFSVISTNLYASRVITLGTLIAVYLSTSDEMLVLLISNSAPINTILSVIGIKIVIGMISGFIIDLVLRRKKDDINFDICAKDACDCHSNNIFISALKHTLKIFIFLFIFSVLLDFILHEFHVDHLIEQNNMFTPFIASLIGLIPNCAASVVLTKLFISEVISFGSLVGGLLTGTGVALLMLFKINKNLKENIKIVLLLYFIGALTGFVINLF